MEIIESDSYAVQLKINWAVDGPASHCVSGFLIILICIIHVCAASAERSRDGVWNKDKSH